MVLNVDHCVFYDIDDSRVQSGVSCASGYAICSVNYPGTMNIKNSIFHTITNSAIRDWNIEDSNFPTTWTVNNDYNCFYQLGAAPFRMGSTGSNSLEDVNPQMKNPGSGDFSLNTGSPCIGQASDGTDIGLSGGMAALFDNLTANASKVAVTVSANPFAGMVELNTTNTGECKVLIYNQAGTPVRKLHGTGQVAWDGRSFTGQQLPAGAYWALIMSDKGNTLVRLVKAE